MGWRTWFFAAATTAVLSGVCQAQVYRWDTGELIPGTEGITPGPGVVLASYNGEWNTTTRNLQFAHFSGGLDLSNSQFEQSWLDNADFSEANLARASLMYATLTRANFQGANLSQAYLDAANLSGADLRHADLSYSSIGGKWGTVVTAATFDGAQVTGAIFSKTLLTKEQFYSTASYRAKNLRGIHFYEADLSGWDFSGQDLRGAAFSILSMLVGPSILIDVDFSDAEVAYVRFGPITSAQMYSTASYKKQQLPGIILDDFGWKDWDLTNQNLVNAQLPGVACGVNLTGADLRGASVGPIEGPQTNIIGTDGNIDGLSLGSRQRLRILDDDGILDPGGLNGWLSPRAPIPITVKDSASFASVSALQLVFGDNPWDSLISFEPGIPVQLGGTLELIFADDVDVASQVGRTLHIFDWTGVSPVGAFTVASPYRWDTANLYTTGEVTLIGVPEPSNAVLAIIGAAVVLLERLRPRGRRSPPWISGCALAVLGVAPNYSQAFTLTEATVADINQAFDRGILSSERLVELYLARIAAYDDAGPRINSLIAVNERALDIARQLDAERRISGPRSPLHGIPVVLKDNIDTFDMPTTAGSLSLRDSVPPDDAFLVQRLRDAGAIIFAKANLDEFGLGLIGRSSYGGQTLNPYDLTKVPMGSSGGTAVAVAANLATLGIGVDAIGSVRLPASAASLVGLKPTLGLISRDGIMAYDRPRESAGPMTRTVTDLALMMDVLATPDAADPWTADSQGKIPETYTAALRGDALDGKRFGRVSFTASGAITSAVDAAYQELEGLNADLGSTVSIGFLPGWYSSLYDGFEHDMNRYLESLGPGRRFADLDALIASDEYLPLLDSFFVTLRKGDVDPSTDPAYAAILGFRDSMRERVLAAMDQAGVDALIYPTLPRTPAPVTVTTRTSWFGDQYFSLMSDAAFLGFPAITVPAGFTADGLPLGIEFMGRPYADADLIGYAYAYEQATRHRRAPLTAPPLPGESVPEPDALALALAATAIFNRRLRVQREIVTRTATGHRSQPA